MATEKTKENLWVDLAKLWCIFVIVAAHCYYANVEALRWYRGFVDSCTQTLFIFSGYYMVKNGSLLEPERAKRYIGHLITMVTAWAVIYCMSDMFYADHSVSDWLYTCLQQSAINFASLNTGHLWYI